MAMPDWLPSLNNIDPWHWWVLGGSLLLLELAAPGVFFVWLALAAFGLGLLSSVIPLDVPGQLLLFAGLSVAAVWLARWLAVRFSGDGSWDGIVAALACIIGHSFPVWLGFKGGKGVATSLGVFLGLMWLPSVIALALWFIVFKMSGYVSLASIVAAVALPATAITMQLIHRGYGWPVSGFAAVVGLLVIARHRSNIARLRAGTENRFGKKKS